MPLSLSQRKKNIQELIYSGSTQVYLALSTTAPSADGTNVTEPSGGNYQRISMRYNIMGSSQENFPATVSYDSGTDICSITNIRNIYFYEPTASWGTIGYFALFDSATSGNMLAYGTLSESIQPTVGTIPVIRAGQLTIKEE